MQVKCPNGCDANFNVVTDIFGTAECEVSPEGQVIEVVDADLEEPEHLQFDEGNWQCSECGEQGFLEADDAPQKPKRGKKK